MDRALFAVLDFGTSSSRVVVFDAAGTPVWEAGQRSGAAGEGLDPALVQGAVRRLLADASGAVGGEAIGAVSAQLPGSGRT